MKYCYCLDDEVFVGGYDSREDAFEAAKIELAYDVTDEDCIYNDAFYFKTAECKPYFPEIHPWDVEQIVENLQENLYETCGIDNWLLDVTKEQQNNLAQMFNKTFREWLKANKFDDEFFVPDNVQVHKIERKDVDFECLNRLNMFHGVRLQ